MISLFQDPEIRLQKQLIRQIEKRSKRSGTTKLHYYLILISLLGYLFYSQTVEKGQDPISVSERTMLDKVSVGNKPIIKSLQNRQENSAQKEVLTILKNENNPEINTVNVVQEKKNNNLIVIELDSQFMQNIEGIYRDELESSSKEVDYH